MYRISTTNDLVIRMGCSSGDTVGRKWGNGKGLRGRGPLKKFWKSAEGSNAHEPTAPDRGKSAKPSATASENSWLGSERLGLFG